MIHSWLCICWSRRREFSSEENWPFMILYNSSASCLRIPVLSVMKYFPLTNALPTCRTQLCMCFLQWYHLQLITDGLSLVSRPQSRMCVPYIGRWWHNSNDTSINSALYCCKGFQHFFQILIDWSSCWWLLQLCWYVVHRLTDNIKCLLFLHKLTESSSFRQYWKASGGFGAPFLALLILRNSLWQVVVHSNRAHCDSNYMRCRIVGTPKISINDERDDIFKIIKSCYHLKMATH